MVATVCWPNYVFSLAKIAVFKNICGLKEKNREKGSLSNYYDNNNDDDVDDAENESVICCCDD